MKYTFILFTAANLTLSLCKGFHKAGFQSSSNAVTDVAGFGQPKVNLNDMMNNLHLSRNEKIRFSYIGYYLLQTVLFIGKVCKHCAQRQSRNRYSSKSP